MLENTNNIYSINKAYYSQIKNILLSKKYLFKDEKSSSKKKNILTINLYLPVKIDTMITRKIAYYSAAVSKYVDLNKDISVNFVNKIYDGVSVYDLQILCGIIHHKYKELFTSDVTEMILRELMKQEIITQEDFYN